MPIYEYECVKCGHHTEAWQKFSDPPLTRCEKCQGELRKLISQSTFHLKGTGWYVTDYASKGSSRGKKETEDKGGAGQAKKEEKAGSTSTETND